MTQKHMRTGWVEYTSTIYKKTGWVNMAQVRYIEAGPDGGTTLVFSRTDYVTHDVSAVEPPVHFLRVSGDSQ